MLFSEKPMCARQAESKSCAAIASPACSMVTRLRPAGNQSTVPCMQQLLGKCLPDMYYNYCTAMGDGMLCKMLCNRLGVYTCHGEPAQDAQISLLH